METDPDLCASHRARCEAHRSVCVFIVINYAYHVFPIRRYGCGHRAAEFVSCVAEKLRKGIFGGSIREERIDAVPALTISKERHDNCRRESDFMLLRGINHHRALGCLGYAA